MAVRGNLRPPVVILGAHRSGTSLVTRLLESCGFFAGWWLESNEEARFFVRLNRMLLRKAGARWDYPEPFRDFIDSDAAMNLYGQAISDVIGSPLAFTYLGPRRYFATRGRIARLSMPWGWKDPRNTFTLPFWLRLFPEAKVIEVRRHGVDVAASLSTRHHALSKRDLSWFQRSQKLFMLGSAAGPLGRSSRVSSTDGAFSVWLDYMHEAERQRRDSSEGSWLQVRYEDLLDDPLEVGRELAAFAGCDTARETCMQFAANVDASRMYAFRRESALQEFAARHVESLERFGYSV